MQAVAQGAAYRVDREIEDIFRDGDVAAVQYLDANGASAGVDWATR